MTEAMVWHAWTLISPQLEHQPHGMARPIHRRHIIGKQSPRQVQRRIPRELDILPRRHHRHALPAIFPPLRLRHLDHARRQIHVADEAARILRAQRMPLLDIIRQPRRLDQRHVQPALLQL